MVLAPLGWPLLRRASIRCLPLLSPVFLLIGLLLPGFFIARRLRRNLWWASAFILSLLVLFQGIFWLGVLNVRITLWSVLSCLIPITAGAAWLARKAPLKLAPKLPH